MSTSRLETTRLLAKVFNIEDFLSPDSLSHDELNYYNSITRVLDRHVDKYVDWLGTSEAQEAFYQESVQRKEYFNSIEDELDEIINDHTLNANRIIEKIYRKGLDKGYKDIKKYPVFNDACKYGLKATQDYNFELITKLSDDLRETIKHDIFKGIAEEKSVHEVARSITDAGLKPLKDKTLTAYQRASLIARTEISRSMSTGRLQAYANYGVEKVRILTAGDSDVCPICRKAAEKVYTLKEAQGLIPFHPACRCSIIAVIEHVVNEDGSINHDVLDKLLKKPIDGNVIDLTNASARSSFWAYYKAPPGAKPFVLKDDDLNPLEKFMGNKNLDNLKSLLSTMNKTCYNCEYEYMIGNTNKRFPMEKAYTSWERDNVYLPEELKDLGEKEHISILIHNHAWGMNILPSDKDIKLLINNNVEYGVITNNSGLVVIKNNNPALNKLESSNIDKIIFDCEKEIIKDLKEDKNITSKHLYTFFQLSECWRELYY